MAELTGSLFVIYCLLGISAGIIGGLLGLGGGIVIVPTLYFLFLWQGFHPDLIMHLAIATSLSTIIFTSISSTYAHHQRQAVLWPQILILTPGIFIGAIFGAFVVDLLATDIMRTAFGLFEIFVAIQTWFGLKPSATQNRNLPNKLGLLLLGSLIGSISTILGIGGGTLTVPILLWCNIKIHKAVGTSSACGLPIALIGTLAMIILGMDAENLPTASLGYVYWPAAISISITSVLFAPLGAKLAHMLPIAVLRKLFALVVFLIGIRILL